MVCAQQAKQMQSEQNHGHCVNVPRRGTGTRQRLRRESFGKLLRCDFGLRIALARSAVSVRVVAVRGRGAAFLKAAAGSLECEIGKCI